jgi:Transglycosylase SLT domain
MTQRPLRLPITVLATVLFLALTLQSTPTTSSVPRPVRPAPDLQEIRGLHRVAGWIAGTPALKILHLRDREVLDIALAAQPAPAATPKRDFQLFRRDAASPEDRLLARLPFGQAIGDAARRNRVDGLLVAAVVEAESSFSPTAVSPRGAMGLMQVLPSTAEARSETLFDPHVNLDAGCRYLGSLIEHYDGDLELALAAYNAGPATVARYGGIPPFQETRDYVQRVLARYTDHQQEMLPKRHGGRVQSPAPSRAPEQIAAVPAQVSQDGVGLAR